MNILLIVVSILIFLAIMVTCVALAVRAVALLAIAVAGFAVMAIGYIGLAVAGITLALSFQLFGGSDWMGASVALAILAGLLTTFGLGRALIMEILSFLRRARRRAE